MTDRPWGLTFGALGVRGLTGELIVDSDGKAYRVAFYQGAIVGAYSPLVADAAVRVALTSTLITSTQVADITRRMASAPDRDEIDMLAELARLTPEQTMRLRRRILAQRASRAASVERGQFTVEDQITLPYVEGTELDIRAVCYLATKTNFTEDRLADEMERLGTWFKLKPNAVADLAQYGFTETEKPILQMLLAGDDLAAIELAQPTLGARTVRAVAYALLSCGALEIKPSSRRLSRAHGPVVTARTSTPTSGSHGRTSPASNSGNAGNAGNAGNPGNASGRSATGSVPVSYSYAAGGEVPSRTPTGSIPTGNYGSGGSGPVSTPRTSTGAFPTSGPQGGVAGSRSPTGSFPTSGPQGGVAGSRSPTGSFPTSGPQWSAPQGSGPQGSGPQGGGGRSGTPSGSFPTSGPQGGGRAGSPTGSVPTSGAQGGRASSPTSPPLHGSSQGAGRPSSPTSPPQASGSSPGTGGSRPGSATRPPTGSGPTATRPSTASDPTVSRTSTGSGPRSSPGSGPTVSRTSTSSGARSLPGSGPTVSRTSTGSGPRSSPGSGLTVSRTSTGNAGGPTVSRTSTGNAGGPTVSRTSTGNAGVPTMSRTSTDDHDTVLRLRAPAGSTPVQTGARATRAPASRRVKTDSGAAREVEQMLSVKIPLLDGVADHFSLLGLPQTATADEIRQAYFVLARKLHPDRLSAIGVVDEARNAQRLMAAVNTAFAVLNDSAKRAEYIGLLGRGGEAAVRAQDAQADELAMRVLRAEEAFRQGEMALRRDQMPQAIAAFQSAVELAPNESEYQALLAWAQFAAAPDKTVIAANTRRALQKAAEASRESTTARFYLGRIERMLGKEREALAHFQEVLRIRPTHAEAASEVRLLEQRLKGKR